MLEESSKLTNENGMNVPEDLIEIRDPDIDAQKIMAEIRDRIDRRRKELGYERRSFPSYGKAILPDQPEDIPYDANLYHHLQLANMMYTEIQTYPVLVRSPASRIPIMGQLWQLIRREAHNLILFYVNRAVSHEVDIHRHMISVDNLLTTEIQEQQRAILELKEEVDRLRSHLDG